MPDERNLFTVSWRKVQKSSQEERDLLYEYLEANDDSTYTIDNTVLKTLEGIEEIGEFSYVKEKLTDEEKKKFAKLLKKLHTLADKYGEVFVIIQ